MKFFAHLIQRRRGPKIVQYTDGQEQVIEQRPWFYCRSSLHIRHFGHALDPVRGCPKPIAKEVMWWANAIIMICAAAAIAPSLVLFVLAFLINLLFSNEQRIIIKNENTLQL